MDMESPLPSGTQSPIPSVSDSAERQQQQQQQLPTTTSFGSSRNQYPCELGTTNGSWRTRKTARSLQYNTRSSSGRTNNSPVAVTPCSSAGSTSPCSDRDSSPEQRVSHADRGGTVMALSPNSGLNFLDPENIGDSAGSSRTTAVRNPGASGGVNLMPHGNGGPATLATVGLSSGSSPVRGGNHELRRSSLRSLAPTEQDGGSWNSSSRDELNLGVDFEGHDAVPTRKGKKRMRHRTPFSSPTPTTAAAGDAVDTANASPPGQEQSKLTAVSFSSPQLLPRSAVESGVSPASSSSSAWQTTLRDGRRATMRLSPRSNRQRSPRLLADTPPPVATSDAPSPLPPLEVLDLSLASPMATEVIDIDTEDSPAPLPPPLRRGLLAHDSLPTTITDTNSSTLRRWTGESGEGYRESVDGMVGAAIGGGRGKAGTATSSGDGAGDADVATAENLRRLPVGLDISSAVGTSHSARRMSVSPTVGPPIAALGGRSSSSSRSSMDTNILRATEGNPADREDERRTVGVSSHRKRRQSQQQTRGLGGRSLSRSTEVKDGENSMSPAVARWTRRRAMLSDNDKMMAARLHQRESLLQEQSDLEMAQRLQSQEAAEQAEYARAVAEVMQVAVHAGGGVGGIGDSGVGAAWPGVLDPGLDFDNHPWEGMDSDSFRDELGSVTLETTDDEANSDDGVFMGERINHRGGTSSGNAANGGGAAARAASAAVAISLPRDRRNVRSRSTRDEANDAPPRTRGASAAVVDVAAAASDHDDVIPLAAGGSGSTSRSAAEGVRVASSRAVRVGGSPRPPPAPNTASGSSFVSTSISSSSSQAAAGAPQRARPGLSRASTHASAGRGGPGSAAGGRGAYSHLRAAASAATATRRPAGASASARSGALPHAPSSGRAGEVRVLSSAAEARRRRQESNGTSRRRMSIAERYRGELHIAHLMSQIMPSMVLHRGFGIGGDGRGSERGGGGGGRGRGGAERGVAGTAAHFALMTRSLTSADYQQLLALDDAGGGGTWGRPKGLSAGEISMLPTQTGNGTGEVEQCCICMDDMKPRQAITRLPACLHTFHSKCISKWLHTHASCPIDKTAVSVSGS